MNLFKLLAYMETSQLCRKLGVFSERYCADVVTKSADSTKKVSSITTTTTTIEPSSSVANVVGGGGRRKKAGGGGKMQGDAGAGSAIAMPMYQVKGFLEALTSKSEDCRVFVKSTDDGYAKIPSPSEHPIIGVKLL